MAPPTDHTATRPDDIPTLGLGTWQNTDPEACRTAVETALEMGYRHNDTAQGYNNESFVGRESQQPTSTARTCFSPRRSG